MGDSHVARMACLAHQRDRLLKQLYSLRLVRRQPAVDGRGAARSDVCVGLGDTGSVRVRTLRGIREQHPDHGRLLAETADDRRPPAVVEAEVEALLGAEDGGGDTPRRRPQQRAAQGRLRVEAAARQAAIAAELAALEEQEVRHQQLHGLGGGGGGGSSKKGAAQGLSRAEHKALCEAREQLQRLAAEGDASLQRLIGSLQKLPTIDVVRTENRLIRAEVDGRYGLVRADHRPLFRQFAGMSLADIDLKITGLEIDEYIDSQKKKQAPSAGSRPATAQRGGGGGGGGAAPAAPATSAVAAAAAAAAPATTSAEGLRERGGGGGQQQRRRRSGLAGAQSFLRRHFKQAGVPPTIHLPDTTKPGGPLTLVSFDTSFFDFEQQQQGSANVG